jgi:chromosomal replication initiator protein DnaA
MSRITKIKPILCDFNHFDQIARKHFDAHDPVSDDRKDVSAKSFGLSEAPASDTPRLKPPASASPTESRPAPPAPVPAKVDVEAIAASVVKAMRKTIQPEKDTNTSEIIDAIASLRDSIQGPKDIQTAELIDAITALNETVASMSSPQPAVENIESFPAAPASAASVAEAAGALPGRDEKLRTAMAEQPPHERFKFDTFLAGKENATSMALMRQFAATGTKLRLPLRLFGGVGLGKTHLLHAAGNAVAETRTDARIRRLTGGMFQRQFDTALSEGALNHFMTAFCEADVFLLDDVQTLAGRRDVQSAFIEIFDALASDGRLVAVSELAESDTARLLAAPLRSRLDSAVTATVRTPELETRLAILERIAAESDVEIQTDALELIAERITTDVRRLIGAYEKIAAYVRASDRKVTKKQMRDLVDQLGVGAVA